MNLLKIKYLILSALLFTACNAPKDCIRTSIPPEHPLLPLIALDSSAPVMYSAEFEVLKYNFSGLIAFRQMPQDQQTRIVFLSEVGIRIMEFSFQNGKIINTYCFDAIKKKSVVKFLGGFLQMLLSSPNYHSVCLTQTDHKSDYFCKLEKGYATYGFIDNNRSHVLLHMGRKHYAEGKYVLSPMLPDEILTTMKFNTKIQLKKVNNAFR
jgi:hypothetical protein